MLPQALVNAKVPNHKKEHFAEYTEIAEAIAEVEKKFAGEGRVLIRPSGTEPLVRVMIEGKNQKLIEEEAKKEGASSIRLDVFTKNPRAVKLYEQAGYEYAGDAYFRKGKFSLMEKLL